jgi:uncharacterized protein CbrC (UPF0167 family)
MKKTFAELGIPFPLYEAPVEASDDSDYAGKGRCCVCQASNVHTFGLGIGTALMVACPKCATINGLDVPDQDEVACRNCDAAISFPSNAAIDEPKVCYSCLRSGHAAITKDTEFGMVSWDQAFSGVTNGRPGLKQDQFEPVVVDQEDDWIGVKLPTDIMFELLRTPTYGSWQGECWLFCCRYPMTFVGEWKHEDFTRRAPDGDGEKLFYQVVEEIPADTWDSLGSGNCVYVFECKRCGKLLAHHDSD